MISLNRPKNVHVTLKWHRLKAISWQYEIREIIQSYVRTSREFSRADLDTAAYVIRVQLLFLQLEVCTRCR